MDVDDSGLDDELFPACDAAHAGDRHSDEYGVTYICDLVDLDEGPTYAWVLLDRPQDHRDR
ncbi:hypothetical protein [Pseudokineococcus marinus]|uniref:Uncharacterized protein n=1 Tax=Pseudokineococcus marinus TaxID=351215 RepID=A0A849BZH1_9ACTN|nr:hypothetical protein [Pseudokineococcus marinus]NNH22878.1 hypothetical protein [Pseudokineococcus marinus]